VTFYRAEVRRGRARVPSWPALKPRLEGVGYRSQVGRGCDCGPLMRGVELRGGRASCRGSMAPLEERGRCTWHGQCERRVGLEKGGGKRSTAGGPAR
jgi:hypothetical protein